MFNKFEKCFKKFGDKFGNGGNANQSVSQLEPEAEAEQDVYFLICLRRF